MTQGSGSIVTVGIAGLGRAGWGIHADTIAPLADKYQVVAVCDPLVERQREAEERFGCRAYDTYEELLADDQVELIVVAVPSHLHAEYSIAALEAGRHVLVEKPMAGCLADVDRMIQAAEKADRILTVNQNYRNMPGFLKVREVVESGVLGRIVLIRIAWHGFSRRWDWQTLKEMDGGQLNNAGTHAIDRALLLLDDPEPEVFCQMETTPVYSGDAESHVKVILRPKSGPMVDIELTSACAYGQDEWLVMGTQGGLTGSSTQIRWRYVDPQDLPPRPVTKEPTPDRSYNREELPWREVSCDLSAARTFAYEKVYSDLYATLREGAPLAITPESVRRQIVILDECRAQSAV